MDRQSGAGHRPVAKEIAQLRRAKEPILAEWTRDLAVITGERAALGEVA